MTKKTKAKTPESDGSVVLSATLDLARNLRGRRFGTILADPPWQFTNRTGKMAPEHKRLARYSTMTTDEICALPIGDHGADTSHLYLWVPNALLPEGLRVMQAWGFNYKSNIVWYKTRKDGGPDGRGVGFYFRNVTELLLFGVRGKNARSGPPASKHHPFPQAGALTQARRSLRHHRGLQHRPIFGIVRAGRSQRLDCLGQSGWGLRAHLEHLCQPFRLEKAGGGSEGRADAVRLTALACLKERDP